MTSTTCAPIVRSNVGPAASRPRPPTRLAPRTAAATRPRLRARRRPRDPARTDAASPRARTAASELHLAQPQRVADDRDRRQAHREARDHGRQAAARARDTARPRRSARRARCSRTRTGGSGGCCASCARQPQRPHDAAQIALHERDGRGLSHRDVGARAHRDPDVGPRERRRVVHAVAGHRDDLPARCSRSIAAALSCGSTSAIDLVHCRARAPTARAVRSSSPVSMMIRTPRARAALRSPRRRGLDRVGHDEHARRADRPRPRTPPSRRARARLRRAPRARRRRRARALISRSLPTATRVPPTLAGDAQPRVRLEVDDRALSRAAAASAPTIRPAASRARARPRRSHARADARSRARPPPQAQHLGLVEALGREHALQARLALGQRAGLVDDQRRDLLEPLERRGVLDQHAPRARRGRCRP